MVNLPIAGTGGSYVVNPGKIVGLGLNYRDHVAESLSVLARGNTDIPAEPVLFAKTPNVLVGPGEPIVIPSSFLSAAGIAAPRTDYEAELAVIIGRRCRRVSARDALSFVFGYSCFNDVSQRNIQNSERGGWWKGKSFDSFGPIGPVVVPAGSMGDPQSLAIECRLNGRVVQSASTGSMIFGVAETIAYVSSVLTLEAGDLIITGTPAGVGPLLPGDVVEVEIGGIGILRNPVTEE
ncbi:MAG: fumarylacetoacetate hydrolase family protein [Spirochaetes bacterium]|nr:fumarylacetoacetate hydrolase family protein [Spirochaetota bacterium]